MQIWKNAQACKILTGPEITGGFDVGFDPEVPEDTRDALMDFIYWVEDHYALPVTLWVDIKFRHYLRKKNRQRAAYLFYWVEFQNYPHFENPDDIPVIELPVRLERNSLEDILLALTQGITDYFHWLSGNDPAATPWNPLEAKALLSAYLSNR